MHSRRRWIREHDEDGHAVFPTASGLRSSFAGLCFCWLCGVCLFALWFHGEPLSRIAPVLAAARDGQASWLQSLGEALFERSRRRGRERGPRLAARGFNSRLIRTAEDCGAVRTHPSIALRFDITPSRRPRTRLRAWSLQDATFISLSGVFPFTSALLGFISALAAGQCITACFQCC